METRDERLTPGVSFFFFFFGSFFRSWGPNRALHFLGKRSTTELNPQSPGVSFYGKSDPPQPETDSIAQL